MKKSLLFPSLAIASMLAGMPSVQAFAANDTTADAYDFSGFDEQKILDLFVKAAENGASIPPTLNGLQPAFRRLTLHCSVRTFAAKPFSTVRHALCRTHTRSATCG